MAETVGPNLVFVTSKGEFRVPLRPLSSSSEKGGARTYFDSATFHVPLDLTIKRVEYELMGMRVPAPPMKGSDGYPCKCKRGDTYTVTESSLLLARS